MAASVSFTQFTRRRYSAGSGGGGSCSGSGGGTFNLRCAVAVAVAVTLSSIEHSIRVVNHVSFGMKVTWSFQSMPIRGPEIMWRSTNEQVNIHHTSPVTRDGFTAPIISSRLGVQIDS